MFQRRIKKIRGNWARYIAIGIPAFFLVYILFSDPTPPNWGNGFWSIYYPVFMSEMYMYHEIPPLIGSLFFISSQACDFSCFWIVFRNKGRLFPWILVVVYTTDVFGMLYLLFSGTSHLTSNLLICSTIFIEIALAGSQIINLWQKNKSGHTQNV